MIFICYVACLLLFTLISSGSGLGIALPLVSSFTCESCDVEETKGPYSMPLFAMFVMPFICHVLM